MHKQIKIYILTVYNMKKFLNFVSLDRGVQANIEEIQCRKKKHSANLLFFKNLLKIISGYETLPVNFLCYFTKHSD